MPKPCRHFDIEELALGVYAAIASDGGGMLCNAGIIDLGSATLVLDTGATLPAALELRIAAERLTGHPVSYVVNSHVHPEHVNGNIAFTESIGIAAQETRKAIASDGVCWMEQMRQQLGGRLEGYPSAADLRVPALSYAGELTFHGSHQTARLIDCGNAHSRSDTVLWLPESGILFAGDLITDGNLVLCDGNPEAWVAVLDRLAALAPRLVVPGHGRVAAGSVAIQRGRAYITELLDQVAKAIAVGKGEDWAVNIPVPEGCGEIWFRENLRFLLTRHQSSSQGLLANKS